MTNRAAGFAAVLLIAVAIVEAHVRTDYDRKANFGRYRTYSWIRVDTQNSLWDDRMQAAVDQQLRARGWKRVAQGGDAAVAGYSDTEQRDRVYTYYMDNGWGWNNFGTAYTQVIPEFVSNFTVDIFDGSTKKLIWSGSGSKTVSRKSNKNIDRLNDVVEDMFKKFPAG